MMTAFFFFLIFIYLVTQTSGGLLSLVFGGLHKKEETLPGLFSFFSVLCLIKPEDPLQYITLKFFAKQPQHDKEVLLETQCMFLLAVFFNQNFMVGGLSCFDQLYEIGP